MYIYIDESFILNKPDGLISISGFSTFNARSTTKFYKKFRRIYLPKNILNKQRIKSNLPELKEFCKRLYSQLNEREEITKYLSVVQHKQLIPHRYYDKKYGKLLFNQLYLDLVKVLISQVEITKVDKIEVSLDRRHLSVLDYKIFVSELKEDLEKTFGGVSASIFFRSSCDVLNIELADFISHLFFEKFYYKNEDYFQCIKDKAIFTENPLT